jgi:hypothetical protein
MQVEELTCLPEKAKTELEALKIVIKQTSKTRNAEVYRDLKRVYGHIQKYGGKIINVTESIKKAGINADGDPKLAIVRADSPFVFCLKHANGTCGFYRSVESNPFGYEKKNLIVEAKTPDLQVSFGSYVWQHRKGYETSQDWGIERRRIRAPTPLIPPSILQNIKTNLCNYSVLWEVEKWENIVPKDPMLLKQLTDNLFVVLASWDLTDLERAVLQGRLH